MLNRPTPNLVKVATGMNDTACGQRFLILFHPPPDDRTDVCRAHQGSADNFDAVVESFSEIVNGIIETVVAVIIGLANRVLEARVRRGTSEEDEGGSY